jgi:hypothetical protein
LTVALLSVAGVWLAGAVWSFEEQTRYAASRGFSFPWLLPLVLDGLAVSLAGVAYAAALDARPAIQARFMTGVAVAASAVSNGAWAWTRTAAHSAGHRPDTGAVALAVGVPVASILAFEVLLGELRRQVHRRRGMPASVAIPTPRLARLLLAPIGTIREWRAVVLTLTTPAGCNGGASAEQVTCQVHPQEHDDTGGQPLHDDVPEKTFAPVGAVPAGPPALTVSSTSAAETPLTTRVENTVPGSEEPVEVGDLLLIGRAVAEDLAHQGLPLNRRNLLAGIRARGRSCSSERASALLRALRVA